ncbi:MAG: RagB/SusD family nutrient uptake outer membrane protein [Mediterranea sp.]|jgi:tetratricopeptide (TPR) repeat protein|nr:RagB/SusD family nutrient uptake outer membrane protein [Mediterranea sp.]
MRNRYKLALSAAFILGLSACDFDTDNYQEILDKDAYKTVQDVQNGMTGAYQALGYYPFLGNYSIAFGDFLAGISDGSASSGHMLNISDLSVTETTGEFSDCWYYGYKVIDACTRTIQGGKQILAKKEEKNLSDADEAYMDSYLGQCYALKALAYYYLVNLYAYPYHAGTDNLGLPLIKDDPIPPFTKVDRSSVGDTYIQITSDLTQAETHLGRASAAGIRPSAFYMGEMGLEALKARVFMDMGRYDDAAAAAKRAIGLKNNGDGTGSDNVLSNDGYINMWTSLAITTEDLFTIAKNESDNLSANSLNTLYGSYLCTLTTNTIGEYADNDIRKRLISGNTTKKFAGLSTSAATSNIPIFRKSEMSLIIAEVAARNNNITEARNYLLFTAKRNTDIASVDDLPDNTDDLLAFISKERIREFSAEGHRLYDARRTNEKVKMTSFNDEFDVSKFVLPIPADEVNAGFMVQQNSNWNEAIPAN